MVRQSSSKVARSTSIPSGNRVSLSMQAERICSGSKSYARLRSAPRRSARSNFVRCKRACVMFASRRTASRRSAPAKCALWKLAFQRQACRNMAPFNSDPSKFDLLSRASCKFTLCKKTPICGAVSSPCRSTGAWVARERSIPNKLVLCLNRIRQCFLSCEQNRPSSRLRYSSAPIFPLFPGVVTASTCQERAIRSSTRSSWSIQSCAEVKIRATTAAMIPQGSMTETTLWARRNTALSLLA